MREIALHLLDIAENSVTAGAQLIEIVIEEDLVNDKLKIRVKDNGRGMDEALLAQVANPFVTSRTTRKVGLGIPLFKAAAETCCGYLDITSTPGQGTDLEVEFQRSHIDRMPLGDLTGTWLVLLVGYPEVRWLFQYRAKTPAGINNAEFIFDSEPIKKELGDDLPLTEPSILAFIREMLQDGVRSVRSAINQTELTR